MGTPQLDQNTAGDLRYYFTCHQQGSSDDLYAFVRSLRAAGWPLASISTALDVSRETPRIWARKAEDLGLDLMPVPVPIRALTQLELQKRRQEDRLESERQALEANLPRLLELQPKAEALRGPSWARPENAAASAEYTRLIDETLKAGVRGRILAEALNVAEITIHARLRRSGLRKTAPSEKVPSWATPGWAVSA